MVSTPASSSSATAARYTPHRSFSTGTERSIVKTGEENTMAPKSPMGSLIMAVYTHTTIRLASTACSPSRSLAPPASGPRRLSLVRARTGTDSARLTALLGGGW